MADPAPAPARDAPLALAAAASGPGISLKPLPPKRRFSLRLAPSIASDLGHLAGFQLLLGVNCCAEADGRLSLRLGPDEWLLLAEEADGRVEQDLHAALEPGFFSLVDIGHRNVAIAVAGEHARVVLNGGCPLDLSDQAFAPGSATRTVLGAAEIVLARPTGELAYSVECWRSFAPYVFDLLTDCAREFTEGGAPLE